MHHLSLLNMKQIIKNKFQYFYAAMQQFLIIFGLAEG
jgi:hypothetical protein